jgi:hypothetical protein
MKGLAAVSFGLASLVASAAVAQAPPPPQAQQQQQQQTLPPEELPGPYIQQVPDPYGPPDPNAAAAAQQQADADAAANAGVYDLSQDNAVAQSYDDGYDPQAAAQFEEPLAPYGQWYDDPSYGRIWEPSADVVGTDFSPYATGGHWALTEFGWTWISDWDWGWAPFHFGRWMLLANGWCWVPGRVWGPGWVAWRVGGGFVGWAPLPPRGRWVGQPVGRGTPWRFTTASQLASAQPTYVPPRSMAAVFARTTVVSNAMPVSLGGRTVAVNAGPTRIAPVGPWSTGRLGTLAPHEMPRVAVQPHPAPIQQVGGGYRAPYPAARGTYAPHGGFVAPPRSGGMGAPRSSAAPTYRAPIYRQPTQTYRAPPRAWSGPPARTYSPAPVARSWSPPPVARSWSPPPARSWSPPPARSWSPPATHFSAPTHSSGFGHAFGGRRR